MINLRGNGLDRVPGGAGLPHSNTKCLGLKDAYQSTQPHLPKDNEEVNEHMKRLQAMLDVATVVDLALDRDDEARGHEIDHRQSPRGDSASSLTPPVECSRR
jgi:hypothetical protein